MLKSSLLLLLLLLLLLFYSSVVIANSAEELTYITEEYPPTNYVENGEVKGLSIDLLKLIWKNLGVKEQKILVYPWARAYYQIQNQDNIVLFTMGKTSDREKLFKWACPIETVHYALYALKKNKIKILSVSDLDSYIVGTIRYDGSEQILMKEFGSPLNISSNVSMVAILEMLAKNRLQLIAYNKRTATRMFNRYGYDPTDYEIVFELKKFQGCFAFSKNIENRFIIEFQRELLKIVNSPVYKTFLAKYDL